MINHINIIANMASAEQPGGISALGIDPWAILAQGLTFLVLYVVIKKYALTKIMTALKNRRETIENSLKTAEDIEKKQTELEIKIADMLHKARLDADEILASAKHEALEIGRRAEASAKTRGQQIIKDAERSIEQEIARAKAELKGEIADLASDVTGTVLRESLTPSHERKLIEMYLKEVL